MATKVVSLNVQGLNSPHKRSKAMRYFNTLKADIICLQETRFSTSSCPRFFHRQYNQVYMSNFSRKQRGVLIAFRNSTNFVCRHTYTDSQGRYIMVSGLLNDTAITVVSYYTPNVGQIAFLSDLFQRVSQNIQDFLILGGDSNLVLHPHIDRSHVTDSQDRSAKSFRSLLREYGLVDCWREFHPTGQDYTHFSPPHNSHSRIDHVFSSFRSLGSISRADILPIAWSDHDAVCIHINSLKSVSGSVPWRLSDHFLADVSNCIVTTSAIREYFSLNSGSVESPIMLWEAHKPVVRGRIIQLVSSLRRVRRERLDSLERTFLARAEAFKQSPSNINKLKLDQAKLHLNTLLDMGAERALFRTSHKFYLKRDRPDTMLAKKLKAINNPFTPIKLRSSTGSLTSNPHSIAQIFQDHLSSLYSAPPDTGSSDPSAFLQDLRLPPLTSAHKELLELPISEAELLKTIRNLPSHKTPGPDGFSNLYYKKFAPALAPALRDAFNAVLQGQSFSSETLKASICMLPKPNTDLTNKSNFRPISLINTDIKLLAKVLANRLYSVIGELIHKDQVGFIPLRQAGDNIRRALLLIHHVQSNNIPSVLLSLDIHKAFDSLSWSYLHRVLQSWGFGPHFQAWISALYSSPVAQVTYAGARSAHFPIQRGTRQGCPLSPLLFALALEPLAQAIRGNPDIEGISVRDQEHKLCLFADDALCFITNPVISLPNLLQTLEVFSSFSGLTVNRSKSRILDINLPADMVQALKPSFPFLWSSSKLKYLGVFLTPSLDTVFDVNYPPIACSISNFLSTWHSYRLSLWGRITAVQMTLLPKILYLFRSLPITVPSPFLHKIQVAVNRFIWAHKKPRLASRLICQRREYGGLAVPDIRKYYLAARLCQLTHFGSGQDAPVWVRLEEALLAPLSLNNLLWLDKQHRPDSLHPITKASLQLWDSTKFKHQLISPFPPLISFLGNPSFPAGIFDPNSFSAWVKAQLTTPLQLHHLHGMVPFHTLRSSHKFPNKEFFRYLQVRSFFAANSDQSGSAPKPTFFERFCVSTDSAAGRISAIYRHLLLTPDPLVPSFLAKWESDLGVSISHNDWLSIWRGLNRGISYASYAETNYKVMSRWYLVPARLHLMDPTRSPLCFRECGHVGSYYHIWWSCPLVQSFWRKVFQWASILCKSHISPDPQVALFHSRPHNINAPSFSLLRILFSVAKLVIAKSWSGKTLSTGMVKRKMTWTMAMEKRTHALNDRLPFFELCWGPWIQHFLPANFFRSVV